MKITQILNKSYLLKIYQYIKRLSIFLFVLFLPTQLGHYFFLSFSYISGVRLDFLAIPIFFTDFLALFMIISHIKIIKKFIKKYIVSIFLVLLLLSLHCAFSSAPLLAFFKLIKMFEWIFVFIVFYYTKTNLLRLVFPLCLGSVFVLILALIQFLSHQSIQGFFYYFGERYITTTLPSVAKVVFNGMEFLRPYATFSHPNSMAGFYLLIFVFSLFATTKTHLEKKIRYALITLSMLIVLISFSKLTLILLAIFWIVYVIKHYASRCKICLCAKLFVILFPILLFASGSGDPYTLTKRLQGYSIGFEYMLKNFLFGSGIGQHIIILSKNINFLKIDIVPQPIHNIFIILCIELGLPIFILCVMGMYKIARNVLVYKKSMFMFLVIVIIATGMFDHYWITLQQNILISSVLLGYTFNKNKSPT